MPVKSQKLARNLKVAFSSLMILFLASTSNLWADHPNGRGWNQSQVAFNRIATFPVFLNTHEELETVAEIVAVSEDGNTLIYTDSETEKIGFIDIKNPKNPQPDGTVDLQGEPTSVAVSGQWALVGVNTSPDFLNPSGHLAIVDITQKMIIHQIDLKGQPDSVAVSPDRKYAAIAIENERNEDIVVNNEEGGLPQLPAGFLIVVRTKGAPTQWTSHKVDLTGLPGVDFPSDPEPEYVDINRANIAAVTLQENNAMVLVNLKNRKILRSFSLGTVNLADIDIEENDLIELNSNLDDVPREPDAVSWLYNYFLVTANEGDLNGGSRGFSIFNPSGTVKFESYETVDHIAVKHGHFPEGRAGKKGNEPEGIEVARYGNKTFIFVGSERGNFVAVYCANLFRRPKFLQLLPTGVGPEGLLAIPKRNLFVVAAEVDDEDEGFRSIITIYKLMKEKPAYPTIKSTYDKTSSLPIPWGALSGLAADRKKRNTLYTVHDSFYNNSRIYTLNVKRTPARIKKETILKENGETVNFDLEGIVQRHEGGFWLVSEGKGEDDTLNLLIRTDVNGNILEKIELPASVNSQQVRFGFEGVAVTKDDDTEVVYVAFQREWKDDPVGFVRIGEYRTDTKSWRFFHYPLDAPPADAWIGLSEIVAKDNNTFWVIERDNQQGTKAVVKKVYEFSTNGITPKAQGNPFPIVSKTLVKDLLPHLKKPKGWVLDKVEGLAIAKDGQVFVVTDNDGLDKALGETQFFSIGNINNP